METGILFIQGSIPKSISSIRTMVSKDYSINLISIMLYSGNGNDQNFQGGGGVFYRKFRIFGQGGGYTKNIKLLPVPVAWLYYICPESS